MYNHSKNSVVQKQHSGSESVACGTRKHTRWGSNGGFHPPKPQVQCMVWSACAVQLLLAAQPEDEPSHTLQPWRSLHQMTAFVIPSLSRGTAQWTLPACLPKHAMYSCLIWTNLKCESPAWQQGLREHKWLHEVSALQITAVETANTAFPLVQYSKQGPLLALTSLPHYAQPSARAVLGQHTGNEVEDYCGSAIWHWIKSPNSSFPSWGPAL